MSKFSCIVGGVASSLLLVPGTLAAGAPSGRLFVGTDQGVFSQAKVFDFPGAVQSHSFFPYDTSFTGDGRADLIAGTGTGRGDVRVFDLGRGSTIDLQPFGPSFTGGVFVAAVPEPAIVAPMVMFMAALKRRRR